MKKYIFSFLIFNLSWSLIGQPCTFSDNCSGISQAQTLQAAPTNIECGEWIMTSIDGCITPNALPETIISECGANLHPTVWFKVKIDENANQFFTFIETPGTWKPVWAIYSGNCNNLKLIQGGTINNPVSCSNGDSNSEAHVVGIPNNSAGIPQTEIYIAVSAVGLIDNPNFTLSVFTQAGCVRCIGNEDCVPESTFTIMERSSSRELHDLNFEPGETVKLCVDFNYDPSETGSDWFHGLVPDFGYGWDLDNFNPDNIESVPSGATWFDENDPNCFPRTSRSVPLLCTYRDKYNNLRLCNFKCEVCPCSTGLLTESLLPSGWFWNTPGGQGCGVLCPSLSYGLPRNDFEAQNIRLCMTLKTKSILKINNDFENLDLKISFNTTSMSITGCWNDPIADCSLDVTQVGPNWVIDPTIKDTCYVIIYDTIYVVDTLVVNVYDTIITTITESISVTDTLIINLNIPDSSNDPVLNRIIVYPNPASSHMYIDFGNHTLMQNYTCQILNALGQPVFFTTVDQKLYYLDLNTWGGKGTYFIKIINDFGQTVETKKIILQ